VYHFLRKGCGGVGSLYNRGQGEGSLYELGSDRMGYAEIPQVGGSVAIRLANYFGYVGSFKGPVMILRRLPCVARGCGD
jgi:hypothetical protein